MGGPALRKIQQLAFWIREYSVLNQNGLRSSFLVADTLGLCFLYRNIIKIVRAAVSDRKHNFAADLFRPVFVRIPCPSSVLDTPLSSL